MPSMEVRYLTVYDRGRKPIAPPKPTVGSLYPDRALAVFDPAPGDGWTFAEFSYRKAGDTWTVRPLIPKPGRSYQMSGLTADSDYECRVRYRNEFGFGPFSDLTPFHTKPAA